jgi:hypothetical protein
MNTPTDLDSEFKPSMLIEAVQKQAPEYPWLPKALEKCGIGDWESPAYVGYVSRQDPNQPGFAWQFATSIILEHESLGMVILDILIDNRLGGIEFVDRIEG